MPLYRKILVILLAWGAFAAAPIAARANDAAFPHERPLSASSEAARQHSPSAAEKSLPLATRRLPQAPGAAPGKPASDTGSMLLNIVGSLAVVLGLFLAVVWFLRRSAPKGSATLPAEVFEVLGRAPLAGRQQAQLVRCGNKLLLLSVMPGGAETLTEITDAAEVDRLAGLCQQARGSSATATFRGMFSQFGSDEGALAERRKSARPLAAAGRLEASDA